MISTVNSCRTLVLTDAGSSGNPWNRAVDLTVTGAGRERTGGLFTHPRPLHRRDRALTVEA